MDGVDEPKRLNIAVDYDGTFTAARDLFAAFCAHADALGHRVYCVTMRNEAEGDEARRDIGHMVRKVICTGRVGKQEHCRSLGISIDIWIDDMPQTIVEGWPA